jgi:LPXTG-motif cell wall-anchored protein
MPTDTVPWILVAIGLLVLILGVVVWKRRKESRQTDYRSYFTTGIVWIASGAILFLLPWLLHGEEFNSVGSFFFAIGLGYIVIGLINRDKWGKQVEVPPETRKKTIAILGLAALVGLLVVLLFMTRFLALHAR